MALTLGFGIGIGNDQVGGLLNGNNLTADTTLFKADRTIKLQVVEGIDTTIRDQMILLNSKQTELYLAFNQFI